MRVISGSELLGNWQSSQSVSLSWPWAPLWLLTRF